MHVHKTLINSRCLVYDICCSISCKFKRIFLVALVAPALPAVWTLSEELSVHWHAGPGHQIQRKIMDRYIYIYWTSSSVYSKCIVQLCDHIMLVLVWLEMVVLACCGQIIFNLPNLSPKRQAKKEENTCSLLEPLDIMQCDVCQNTATKSIWHAAKYHQHMTWPNEVDVSKRCSQITSGVRSSDIEIWLDIMQSESSILKSSWRFVHPKTSCIIIRSVKL